MATKKPSDQLAKFRARLVELRDEASRSVLYHVKARNIAWAEKHVERYDAFVESIDEINELIKANRPTIRKTR